jgi:hypothetical protein
MILDEFFTGYEESRPLFEALRHVIDEFGPIELAISKSQIAFRRVGQRSAFARVWLPKRYLQDRGAPLVLTLGFRQRDTSPRWKEIVEPRPGRFTHHLALWSLTDIDEEVRAWLHVAWVSTK